MIRRLLLVFGGLVVGMLFAVSSGRNARADTSVESASVALTSTSSTQSVALNQFSVAGELHQVTVTVAADASTAVDVGNLTSATKSTTASVGVNAAATGPGVSALTAAGTNADAHDLAPTEHSTFNVDSTGTQSIVLTDPAVLASYIGGGTVSFDVTGLFNVDVSGPAVWSGHGSANGTATVTVEYQFTPDIQPTAVNDTTTVAEDSGATAVDVLANDTDPDGGPKTIVSVTQPANGTVAIMGGGTALTYDPNPNYCNDPPGTTPDTFTYTVNGGSTATVSVTVTCVPDLPIAVDDTTTVAEDSGATAVDVLANDINPDPMTMTVASVTQPANGTVVITGAGTGLTYQPDPNYCNNPPGATPDTFTYTLDPGGSTATVSATVTCVDDPPTAVNDTTTVTEDDPATPVDVLANDTDVDGGPKSIASVTQPANGTVVVTGGGTGLTYQPDPNYCNNPPGATPDTFTYTLDPGGSTATVSATVTCVDDPPTAVNDTVTVLEDSGATAVDVLANDTDVDGGPKSIALVTQPANGTVVVTGGGTGLTYEPDPNYCNNPPGATPDTFTYTLDPGGSTATVSVTVACVNDPPVNHVPAAQTIDEDTTLTFSSGNGDPISVTDVDAGAGPVTTTLSVGSGSLTLSGTNGLTFTQGDGTDDAAIQMTGTLASINAALEGMTYRQPADANGADTLTIVTDDLGHTGSPGPLTDTDTVAITVIAVNDAPAFTLPASPDQTVLEDAGPQTVAGFATGIAPGPANESAQTVTFDVTNDNNALFAVQPALDATGNLTYTALANAFGTATVSVTLHDNGGTANGGQDTSGTQTFTITVSPVNDAPSFTKGPDQTVIQDTGTHTVNGWATNITPGPSNEAGQTVHFNVSSDNNGLFSSQPAVDATGTLTFTPASGQTGSATVTVTLQDDGGTANGGLDTSALQMFTVTVNPPDQPPTAANLTATALEDVPTTITFSGDDADGDALTFSFAQPANGTVTTSNSPVCSGATPNHCTLDVTYTGSADFFGPDAFTYTTNDGQADSADATVTITVTPVNDAPSFTKGADQTVLEDSGPQVVNGWATNIAAGPTNETGQIVTFVVTGNTNAALFSVAVAVDAAGNLTYTPAANAFGAATITLHAHDDGGTANGGVDNGTDQTFVINVTGVNDAPSFTKGANQTVNEDAGAQTVNGWATNISSGPANESAQTVDFVASNNNNGLFSAQPAVSAVGVLTYTPAANQNGSATVTVHIHDNGGTANGGSDTSADQTFTVSVNAVNDPPSFTKGADQTVLEDSGAQVVNGWATNISAGPPNETGQTVTLVVTGNTNAALFSVAPAVDSGGNLTFTPAPNAFGSSTITLHAHDDAGTANGGVDNGTDQTFVINVTGVNDAPSFTKGANQTVNEDAGPQTVNGWATNISPGPSNESAQTVDFVASNNNNGLFSAQPAVSPAGVLTYTSAANQNGTATVTVHIHDNGGGANGGTDTSADQTFTITVNPVNDAPVAQPKSFTAETNMKINLGGFLAGVTDADTGINGCSPTFTVAGAGVTSPPGGTVTITNASTGTVDFDPPAGVTGSVTFTYTVADNGCPGTATSAPATATVTVSGPVIWFVDNTNGNDANPGTLGAPFQTLGKADTVDAASHRVFLYNGTYTNGLALNTGEWLIGQQVTGTSFDTVMGITPPAGTIARPAIATGTATVQNTITLNTNAVVRGLAVSSGANTAMTGTGGLTGVDVSQTSLTTSTGTALLLNNVAGTVTLSNVIKNGTGSGIDLTNVNAAVTAAAGSISNTTVAAVSINGGTGAFNYPGTIANSTGRSVQVQNKTGGTAVFSGDITATGGTGIALTSNTGATVNFTGAVTLSTAANPAFTATGGGTISATNTTSTLTTTTATALNIANTTIGSSGLTFRTINVDGNDSTPTNGIVLTNTGSSGGLTVTGTGTASSGGTIQDTSGDGILLTTTQKLSLSYMNITSNLGDGIGGSSVNGLALDHDSITSNGDNAATDESGINLTEVTGTASGGVRPTSITNSTISNNWEFEIQITNNSGTLTDFQMAGNTISANGLQPNHGNLVNFLGHATAVMKLTVTSGTFTGNTDTTGGKIITATAISAVNQGASHTVNVSGATFTNNNAGVDVSSDPVNTTLMFNISNNNFQGSRAVAINSFQNGNPPFTRTVTGTINGNTIGTTGTIDSGSQLGNGISISNEGAISSLNLTITNNQIHQITNFPGISVNVGLGGATTGGGNTTLAITGNSFDNIGSRALTIQDNQDSTLSPFPTICASISSNTFGANIIGQAGNGQLMRIRELSGTVNIVQATPTAAASAAELDDANGFNDPTKINISGGVAFSQTCP